MKAVYFLALAIFLAGCGHSDKAPDGERHASVDAEDEHGASEEGVEFSPKYGLLVPKETAKFIGLKIIDVEEKKVASTSEFSAQVYDIGSGVALLSGLVSKELAKGLTPGEKVSIGFEGEKSPGKISAINDRLASANGLIEVLLQIPEARESLKIGSFVAVSVPRGKEESVVSIPKEALLRTVEGKFVYTVSGEHLVRTSVKVGAVDETQVEVTEGLLAGDQIAVTPVMSLWLAELQTIRGGQSCAHGH